MRFLESAGPGALQAAARHRVANVDVKDHEEHSEDDQCLHLYAKAERILLVESTAIEGTQVLRASKS